MLPGMISAIAGRHTGRMIDVLTSIGLTTNLKLCLDAGDAASYTSGQTWFDRSGGGFDFFLGSSSGSESADPTFNGNAGGNSSSEFFDFLNFDRCSYDSANEAWMDAMHKDSAQFSIAAWIRFPLATGVISASLGDDLGGSGPGIQIVVTATAFGAPPAQVTVRIAHTSGYALQQDCATTLSRQAWHFVGISVDESGNTLRFNIDGTATSHACTYSTPAATGAPGPYYIGNALGVAVDIANYSVWQARALSAAELQSLFQATRGKFGI